MGGRAGRARNGQSVLHSPLGLLDGTTHQCKGLGKPAHAETPTQGRQSCLQGGGGGARPRWVGGALGVAQVVSCMGAPPHEGRGWGGVQAAQASSCAARCRTCSSAHVPRALPARAKRGGRSYSRCWHNSGVGQCPPLRGSSSVGKSEAFQARARAMNLFRVKVCQSQQSVRPRSTRFVSPHAQALIVCAGHIDWSCADAAAADPTLSASVGVNGNAGLSPSAGVCCGSVAGTRQASVVHQLWTPLHDHGGRH